MSHAKTNVSLVETVDGLFLVGDGFAKNRREDSGALFLGESLATHLVDTAIVFGYGLTKNSHSTRRNVCDGEEQTDENERQ